MADPQTTLPRPMIGPKPEPIPTNFTATVVCDHGTIDWPGKNWRRVKRDRMKAQKARQREAKRLNRHGR